MNKDKDINNKNSKGLIHGYQEWYANDGKLTTRGNHKNIRAIGYLEWHQHNVTYFYIK